MFIYFCLHLELLYPDGEEQQEQVVPRQKERRNSSDLLVVLLVVLLPLCSLFMTAIKRDTFDKARGSVVLCCVVPAAAAVARSKTPRSGKPAHSGSSSSRQHREGPPLLPATPIYGWTDGV